MHCSRKGLMTWPDSHRDTRAEMSFGCPGWVDPSLCLSHTPKSSCQGNEKTIHIGTAKTLKPLYSFCTGCFFFPATPGVPAYVPQKSDLCTPPSTRFLCLPGAPLNLSPGTQLHGQSHSCRALVLCLHRHHRASDLSVVDLRVLISR